MNPIRSHTTLQGKLDHITYYNEDNHYTIARLKTKEVQTYITIVGYLAGVAVGQQLICIKLTCLLACYQIVLIEAIHVWYLFHH
ncbi:hypothetical protein QUF90_20380 [Desulfococcaceae bacterium HSG9]|nr:hypothetical protein [Desulfococcaceae bacterium HSG9]